VEQGRETLAQLAAEAAGEAVQAIEADAVSNAPPPPPEASLELSGACQVAVTILGGIICDRARVEPLSAAESQGLGQALAGVLALYLPADMLDPVTARWFALAGAVAAVAVPRLGQRREAPPAAPAVAPSPFVPRADGPLPPGPLLS
jgi:hypothetical protein